MKADKDYEIDFRKRTYSVPICHDQMKFTATLGVAQLFKHFLSLMIVVQNLLSRILFIELTKIIKFTSTSQRMRFILISVFMIYFLNYGVLYLLAPMKLRIPFLPMTLGVYYDFNQYWYSDIGN